MIGHRELLGMFGALALLCALALLAPSVGAELSAAVERVDVVQPYFSAQAAVTRWLLAPLAVLGAIALVLAPGLLLVLVFGGARDVATWLLGGFALGLPLSSAVAVTVPAGRFGSGCAALAALCAGAVWLRRARLRRERWPLPPHVRGALGELARHAAMPLLLVATLAPKFFWEAFNGDGAHAFEATRLLLTQALPFWPPGAGEAAAFPGAKTLLFAYPGAWFMRLFGECEAAVRLPFALYLVLLSAALHALRGRARGGAITRGESLLLALGLASYALVMSYSATYDPYCADIALPATQDTLTMVCFLGLVVGHTRDRPAVAAGFTAFTLLCSPSGTMLIALWLVAVVIGHVDRPGRGWVAIAVAALATMAVQAVAPALLAATNLPVPGSEHGFGALLKKFKYVYAFDWSRLALLVLPVGVYPLLGLLHWSRRDAVARTLWLTAIGAFAIYFAMAFVSLHYFAPAMVLALAAFWADPGWSTWSPPRRRVVLAGSAAAALVAVWCALPRAGSIHVASREVGREIAVDGFPDYAIPPFGLTQVALLAELFPRDGEPEVPGVYGGSPLAWYHYARTAPSGGRSASYALLAGHLSPPPAATRIAGDDAVALWVLDPERWAQHREMKPRTSNGRSIYSFPRDILFRRVEAAKQRFPILDLGELIGR